MTGFVGKRMGSPQLATIAGGATCFVYDGLGRRQRKIIAASRTEFLYDGVNPVQEANGPTVLANILGGLGIDEVFVRTGSAGARNFLTDALGSTLALTDSAGAVQTEYTYEPFGGTTVTGLASTNSFQYTGRENDGTGLYYYRARYYHPAFQRFISEDPIEFEGGDINLYAYVWNDPLMYVDPEGLGGAIIIGGRTGLIPRQLFPSQRGGPPPGGYPRPVPNPVPRYAGPDPRQPNPFPVPKAGEGPHEPPPFPCPGPPGPPCGGGIVPPTPPPGGGRKDPLPPLPPDPLCRFGLCPDPNT